MRRGDRQARTSVLELALALPAAICLAAALAGVAAAAAGYFAPTSGALTAAEAAALRDRAELLRMIAGGVDVRSRSRVRGGIIREQSYLLTPLEAATATQRDDVVRLLVEQGIPLDESSFPIVYCIAAVSDFDTLVDLFRELAPDLEQPRCADVQLPL